MKSTSLQPEHQHKATVLVLRHSPGERLSLLFALALAKVETIKFDCEHELSNWLRHCIDDTTPILAVIIEASFFERSLYRFDGKGALALRGIPLLVVDTARDNRDWCRLDADWQNGLNSYLVTMNLLPKLLEHLRRMSHDRTQNPQPNVVA